MHRALKLHPDSQSSAATHIEVGIERPHAGTLVLSYVVTGQINNIRIPPVAAAVRADELWRHTCFEAFVGVTSSTEYYEFNFAPSTQWAAYRFSSYRGGMDVVADAAAPSIGVQPGADQFILRASLKLDRLPDLPPRSSLRLGVSALIEDAGGQRSYWALAHPPGRPDFHHADGFVHELTAAAS
jgi:hypothetical protein